MQSPEGMRTTLRALVQRHPALSFYLVAFAISWGGLLAVAGPSNIVGTTEDFERLFPRALPMVALGPTIAGLLMTWLIGGRRGLRELRARLFTWRVDARWYAIALLLAPIYFIAVGLGFGMFDANLLPAVFTADDKTSLVLSGLAGALVAGIVEEIGWTGFATPTLRRRYSATTTGLIVGLLWGFWHFLPKIWGAEAHGMTPYLPVDLLSALVGLTGFRILMVWVYDRTHSLLIGILMHVGLTAATLFLQPLAVGRPLLIVGLVLSAFPWLLVAGIAIIRHRATIRSWIQRHPAVSYFALTFAISWGGILAIIGPTNILAEPEVFDGLTWVPPLVLGPSISGILMTAIVGGRRGLRDYRSRLFRWRVGARWLAFALLFAPVYATLTSLALSAFSPRLLPAFITSDDKASLLITGSIVALSAGIFEEAGWTGFATPTLRRRHSAVTTGVIVGLMWSLWHVLPEVMGARALGYVALLPLQLLGVFINLTGFRILMVWVFDRTRHSLLVGILLHTGLTASLTMGQPQLFGAPLVWFGFAQGAVLWVIIGAAALIRKRRTRGAQPPRDRGTSWPTGAAPTPAH